MHDTPKGFTLAKNHAAAIGYVAAHWSLVEDHIAWLIYNLLGLQSLPGEAMTAELPTLQRIVLARTLIGLTGDEAWIMRWAEISSEIERLRTERNNIIHTVWRGDAKINDPVSRRVKAKGRVSINYNQVSTHYVFDIAAKILFLAQTLAEFNTTVVAGGAVEIIRSKDPPGPPPPQAPLQHARIRDQKLAQKEAQRSRNPGPGIHRKSKKQ